MPRRAELRWRPIMLQATAIWVATRLAFAALTYYAILYSSGNRNLSPFSVPLHTLLASWEHWDAIWYIHIATLGYTSPQPTAFFPLYPLLIHLLLLLVGPGNALEAALLIANLGTWGAFIGLALLAANEVGAPAARAAMGATGAITGAARTSAPVATEATEAVNAAWRTLRVFIAYPLALFLTAPYTEGLFVAFVAAALLCARRGSWRWAALWALLAGLTRPTGLALVPALAWEFGRQHGWWQRVSRATRVTWVSGQVGNWRERVRPVKLRFTRERPQFASLAEAILVLGAVPAAIASYMLYCWVRFGHPTIFLAAERIYWGHTNVPPWTALWLALGDFIRTPMLSAPQARLLMDFVPLVVFGVLALVGMRRLPLMFTLYTFCILYLSIASPRITTHDVVISVGRYLIAAVPVFFLLGQWTERRPWLDALLTTTGLLVQAILTLVYLHNGLVY